MKNQTGLFSTRSDHHGAPEPCCLSCAAHCRATHHTEPGGKPGQRLSQPSAAKVFLLYCADCSDKPTHPGTSVSGQALSQQFSNRSSSCSVPLPRHPLLESPPGTASQLRVKHDMEMQRLKQMWQRSCISALCDLLAFFFPSCLHFSLSFPCHALPHLLFFTLSCSSFTYPSYITSIGLQFRELDLS